MIAYSSYQTYHVVRLSDGCIQCYDNDKRVEISHFVNYLSIASQNYRSLNTQPKCSNIDQLTHSFFLSTFSQADKINSNAKQNKLRVLFPKN